MMSYNSMRQTSTPEDNWKKKHDIGGRAKWKKSNRSILNLYGAEWPSGLKCCNESRKVPGSNSTRCLTQLRDPTRYETLWPAGQICKTQWLTLGEWDS